MCFNMEVKMKIPVGVVGAKGYAARELIKILISHPCVNLVSLGDNNPSPEPITQIFPQFRKLTNLNIEPADINKINKLADVIFLALPHKVAQEYARPFINAGKKVIDLSADFRFDNVEIYEKYYNIPHQEKELNKEAVYGMPELFRDKIKTARMIASPGCYPTSVILGLAPLMSTDWIDFNSIIADSKSGVSGAGRVPSPITHYHECNESIKPYSVASHRHTPEIEEKLSILAKKEIVISFTPHLTPMDRGILSTIYVNLKNNISEEEIYEKYNGFYKDEPFVRFLPKGEMPLTKAVAFTNFCDIGLKVDKRTNRLIVASVIDNLIKGASGQAVQSFNIIMGIDERMGLLNI